MFLRGLVKLLTYFKTYLKSLDLWSWTDHESSLIASVFLQYSLSHERSSEEKQIAYIFW